MSLYVLAYSNQMLHKIIPQLIMCAIIFHNFIKRYMWAYLNLHHSMHATSLSCSKLWFQYVLLFALYQALWVLSGSCVTSSSPCTSHLTTGQVVTVYVHAQYYDDHWVGNMHIEHNLQTPCSHTHYHSHKLVTSMAGWQGGNSAIGTSYTATGYR